MSLRSSQRAWWRAYKRAQGAVGRTDADAARWLCRFARLPEARSPGRAPELAGRLLAWEVTAFIARSSLWAETVLVASRRVPGSALPELQKLLTTIFRELRERGQTEISADAWKGFVSCRSGRVRGWSVTADLPPKDAFAIRVHETLVGLPALRRRLYFCSACRQPFVAARSARTCGAACRTIAWRKTNPRRSSELRHQAYRRKVAKQLGKPPSLVRVHRRVARPSSSQSEGHHE